VVLSLWQAQQEQERKFLQQIFMAKYMGLFEPRFYLSICFSSFHQHQHLTPKELKMPFLYSFSSSV
jgi:hypothetical protein